MNKITMPNFKRKPTLKEKLDIKCKFSDSNSMCLMNCMYCALFDEENYKKWKSQQPKSELIKYLIPDKEPFFVIPRAIVNKMSKKWKKAFNKMYFDIFMKNPINDPFDKNFGIKFRVFAVKNGKGVKMPDEFKDFHK